MSNKEIFEHGILTNFSTAYRLIYIFSIKNNLQSRTVFIMRDIKQNRAHYSNW
jgi:hypothetical protein